MKDIVGIFSLLLIPSLASGFAPTTQNAVIPNANPSRVRTAPPLPTIELLDATSSFQSDATKFMSLDKSLMVPATVLLTALPVEAAGVVPSALWAYAHYLSILVITGCLVAEKNIVKAEMSVDDEDTIVKIDLVYGLMAALLIISGFARAAKFGQGGDFYIHEVSFWIKMAVSGVWGGLSLFPSLTFYKRNYARKNDEVVPPLPEKLAARLQQVINAEISAILTIPFLATLMARGVWYWQDFPWQVGAVIAIAATGGSFFLYGRQALNWTDDDEPVLAKEE